MKKIVSNKYVLIGLGVLVTVALLFLGHKDHSAGDVVGAALANAPAAISLTEEEKSTFNENEQKLVLAMKKVAKNMLEGANKGVITKEDIEGMMGGLKLDPKSEDAKTLKEELEDLKEKARKQGTTLQELSMKRFNIGSQYKSIGEVLLENKQELNKIYKAGAGFATFELRVAKNESGEPIMVGKRLKEDDINKAADVHNTTTVGANASIAESLSSASRLRGDYGSIETIQRDAPWILDLVDTGTTDASTLIWFDENARQGNFAITAEGAQKPLTMYSFTRKSSDYKKVAGYSKLTEEFDRDFPGLVSQIKSLMAVDCKNQMNNNILTDMVSQASAYSNAALVGKINNADDYAAIGAAWGQLGNFYYQPNLLIMNNNRSIESATLKGTDGHYLNPQRLIDEISLGSLKRIKHPSVSYDNFFLGDGKAYKVMLKGSFIVRIGWENDDFRRNQFSLVVEQYYYNYISSARQPALVYGNFGTIKTAIETP